LFGILERRYGHDGAEYLVANRFIRLPGACEYGRFEEETFAWSRGATGGRGNVWLCHCALHHSGDLVTMSGADDRTHFDTGLARAADLDLRYGIGKVRHKPIEALLRCVQAARLRAILSCIEIGTAAHHLHDCGHVRIIEDDDRRLAAQFEMGLSN